MRITFFILAISFLSCASCQKMNVEKTITNPPKGVFYSPDKFVMGTDLSYVNQVEDYGGVFKDSGQVKDVFKLLKARGNNLVRVRLWHSPNWTASNTVIFKMS
jgi:arabinogalactan endo-1,4-beta-galactosidase